MLTDHINDSFRISRALIRNRSKAFKIYHHKGFYRLFKYFNKANKSELLLIINSQQSKNSVDRRLPWQQ